eukprot:TRINITY_DN11292_c0_g1_i3.p1 TRINITY_DN11292_c0_g1~~TRINITY_DN11292_c0_g1_i3.p1  ORF type:complete len:257 (-),score=40.02 TRINITY_DN11292_c0_g1_i3:230-1000(-)
MREALCIHIGQAGVQIGNACWELLWVSPLPDADERIKDLAREASLASEVPWELRGRSNDVFDAKSGKGAHTCRAAARIRCLQQRVGARRRRFDEQGLQNADVEVLSSPLWKRWLSTLDARERGALRTWRAGALASPTRMSSQADPVCPFCGAEWASARHCWADCKQFDKMRRSEETLFGFDSGWWSRQPPCTSKSGWITFDAAQSLEGRAKTAIAANRLGIALVIELGQAAENLPGASNRKRQICDEQPSKRLKAG